MFSEPWASISVATCFCGTLGSKPIRVIEGYGSMGVTCENGAVLDVMKNERCGASK